MSKTVAVDVDHGELSPEKAAVVEAACAAYKAAGWRVLIHDSLANTYTGLNILVARLRDAGVDSYDEVWAMPGKPAADVYVGDNHRGWDDAGPGARA